MLPDIFRKKEKSGLCSHSVGNILKVNNPSKARVELKRKRKLNPYRTGTFQKFRKIVRMYCFILSFVSRAYPRHTENTSIMRMIYAVSPMMKYEDCIWKNK